MAVSREREPAPRRPGVPSPRDPARRPPGHRAVPRAGGLPRVHGRPCRWRSRRPTCATRDRAHRRDGGGRPDPGRDRRRPARGRVRRAAAVRRGRRRVPARERILLLPRRRARRLGRCPFFAARALQGVGDRGTLPAALSLVPRMLPKAQTSSGIAFVGARAQPDARAAAADLDRGAQRLVVRRRRDDGHRVRRRRPRALVSGCRSGRWSATASAVAGRGEPPVRDHVPPRVDDAAAHRRDLRRALGRDHRLSPRPGVEQAGADIGLYFAADGFAIFAMRIPTGWLTNRVAIAQP